MNSHSSSTSFRWLAALAAAVFLPSALLAADPLLSNVQGQQRPGTKLVDITYDVTADTPTVAVTLRISSDGGATFDVPATTVSGAVGADVSVGTGKVITWNAGADWLGNYSTAMRYEVTVDDGVAGVPEGFSLIPAGPFMMGDTLDGISDAPPVTVNVSAFYIGKYEVTKALWDEVRSWGLLNGYNLSPGGGKAANHPVHSISWFDMVKWCNARSEKEGLTPVYTVSGAVMKTGTAAPDANWSTNGYRLPTEAEWEKAARGGVSGKRFPWGADTISHGEANYRALISYIFDLSGSANNYHPTYFSGSTPYTSPVGAFGVNPYGLYDVAGNVREWCWDWYGESTYVSGEMDVRGPSSGTVRVDRGGGWGSYAFNCNVAGRSVYNPIFAANFIGFRVAQSLRSAIRTSLSGPAVVDTRNWSIIPSTTENGDISGGGIFNFGTPATLTATPSPGYRFTGWTGDASGTTNPLTITMDADKMIGATFEKDLSDADSDGLTAYDELVTYGTNPALADTDGDGLSDAYELGIGRFSIVSGTFTWHQARNDAQSKGGDLASFPTEDRWNRALQGLGANPFDEFTGLWIGASDAAVDGTWTWVNGEPFNFAPWGTGRPSSTFGNTLDFAEVSGGGGAEIGKWYDRSATMVRDGYLLETGPTTSPTVADADGDGLNDGQEQAAGTRPTTADTDGDGLSDGQEVNQSGTNPKLPDTDGDGANDAASDEDGDGLTNLAEVTTYGTNPQETDTDGDGLSDSQEVNLIGTDPKLPDTDGNGSNDADSDQDGDGLGNLAEITPYDTDPLNTDTDGDGLSDGQEVNLSGTNPKLPDTDSDGTNDAGSDQDGDGLSNLAEITLHGTDPQETDTDGDGLSDSTELNHPGRYFSLIEGSFTHAQASADAATRRGRLASFPNASDFTRMAARARKTTQGYLWLGLSDAATEGTWLWTDGSTATYARWLNGQPDGGPSENHAVLMENSNQWADAVAEFVAAGYLFERVGLDPLAADTDSDGLSDGAEINTHQTSPALDDSDSDGLSDGAEINTHSSNPKLADTDSDGLSDFAEVVTHGTNPSVKDSDGDGFDDLFEINTGFNPTQQASTPDALSSIRTAVEFRFNASNGASYRIEGSTDLQNWETVETDIIGTGGVVTRFYSIENQPKRYFRVVKVAGSSDPDGDGI